MELSVSEEVLAMLVCPQTHRPLHLASPAELDAWTSDSAFEGALVTLDGARAYPIRNGVPALVAGEALRRKEE